MSLWRLEMKIGLLQSPVLVPNAALTRPIEIARLAKLVELVNE